MTAAWRPAITDDAPRIAELARAALGDYGEAAGLYAERIALSPEGCWVLADGAEVIGHCISHPWHRLAPPDDFRHGLARSRCKNQRASAQFLQNLGAISSAFPDAHPRRLRN